MEGNKSYRIVVAEPFDSGAVDRLEQIGDVRILEDSAPQTLIDALEDADALLVRTKAHVTARIIDAAPSLKVIGRASPTVDHIDMRAAKRRNISVVYAPRVAVTSTAEFALGLMISLSRGIPALDRQIREGKFDTLRTPQGHEMAHQTIGLLGIDPVAEALGRMCIGTFGSRTLYHDPNGRTPTDLDAEATDLEGLLTEADIISVHLPLSPATRGLLDADRLALLKQTAVIVNTSRGGVIDTVALAQALRRKHLAGAALDVFETEPLPATHPIRRAPNCVLTPHVAGATLDASAGRYLVADDVVRVLKGQEPQFPVP